MFDGLIEDLLDSMARGLATFAENLLAGVTSFFKFAMMTNPADDSTFGQFLPGTMIGQHPTEFFGGGMWTLVENLCNSVIVPIAAFMLTIVLVTDLIQVVISGNQFQEANFATIMKWFIKAIVGLMIVSNVYYIASGIFSLGVSAGAGGLDVLDGATDLTITFPPGDIDRNMIGILLLVILLTLITFLLTFVLFLVISVVLAGRIIEIFMYLSVAPLTAATFMNNEWKSVGFGWVKGVIALAFQGFFVVVALAVFVSMLAHIISLATVGTGVDMNFVLALGVLDAYLVALMFTVMRSGSISKAIFNAQ